MYVSALPFQQAPQPEHLREKYLYAKYIVPSTIICSFYALVSLDQRKKDLQSSVEPILHDIYTLGQNTESENQVMQIFFKSLVGFVTFARNLS